MTARLPALAVALLVAGAAAAQAPRPDGALAARVAAADGEVHLRYAARPGACGDGRELIALGDHIVVNGGYRSFGGRGWSRDACVPGPVRVALGVAGGRVREVRVRVGGTTPPAPAGAVARDLGAVPAADAAAYLLGVARGATGRAAERAVMAVAVADSADVWRPLLDLARAHADESVARTAMHWMGAVAPPAAVPAVAGALRDGGERRAVREGAAIALTFMPEGAGVPALVAAAAGVPNAGGGDAWVRDRAVFWLGNARDPRGRATLRALAAADTAPEAVRGQAIFALSHLDRGDDDGAGGDNGTGGNSDFLRALYPRLGSERLRDRLVQGVAQHDDPESGRWLLGLAADGAQTVAARKQALFWAGQRRHDVGELLAVDARLTGAELRRHYTFVLSQRSEDAAVDRLIAIARADADPAVRRQATFWLGQSRSPRARRYLEDVVLR